VSVRRPPVLLLRTAGTNCDAELAHAFEAAGGAAGTRHLEEALARPALLDGAAVIAFPGGFTYGDDVASGAVFAAKLRARLLGPLAAAVERGCLVFGVCNGFQILARAGLLPALGGPGAAGEATLGFNDSGRFEDRWVELEGTSDRSPWVPRGFRFPCPVAHGEGKFAPRDADLLRRLEEAGQVVVRYRGPTGPAGGAFPANPNGSVNDIAGICDPTGRVFGLMPHPERNALPWHHPLSGGGAAAPGAGEGLRVFENAVRWAREHA
jgi:phosphoribosylformylglycinamidine synthase I